MKRHISLVLGAMLLTATSLIGVSVATTTPAAAQINIGYVTGCTSGSVSDCLSLIINLLQELQKFLGGLPGLSTTGATPTVAAPSAPTIPVRSPLTQFSVPVASLSPSLLTPPVSPIETTTAPAPALIPGVAQLPQLTDIVSPARRVGTRSSGVGRPNLPTTPVARRLFLAPISTVAPEASSAVSATDAAGLAALAGIALVAFRRRRVFGLFHRSVAAA